MEIKSDINKINDSKECEEFIKNMIVYQDQNNNLKTQLQESEDRYQKLLQRARKLERNNQELLNKPDNTMFKFSILGLITLNLYYKPTPNYINANNNDNNNNNNDNTNNTKQ